jgi:peroxiredoxin
MSTEARKSAARLVWCLAVAALLGSQGPRVYGASVAAPRLAPDFTRNDLDGKTLQLQQYRGKLVLLNFWATWCAPCLSELPRFAAWQRSYGKDGLQIIGVSMDEDETHARRMSEKMHLSYPVVMGNAQLGDSYGGVMGLPLSYLIDPRGRIIDRFEGEPDLDRMLKRIQARLPKQPVHGGTESPPS